ncbi:MAG TPA: hypothetical protein PKA20_22210 [Burkholderiaceae bacterium]|nr:hypothetical protein [Burkholderiaceae bacterium]
MIPALFLEWQAEPAKPDGSAGSGGSGHQGHQGSQGSQGGPCGPAHPPAADEQVRSAVSAALRALHGLTGAWLFTPARARDPLLPAGSPPRLVVQAYFDSLDALALACTRASPLCGLAGERAPPALQGTRLIHQPMIARQYPVPAAPALHMSMVAAPDLEAGAAAPSDVAAAEAPAVPAAPGPTTPAADPTRCSYLVSYEGPADDLDAWLAHYLGGHPPLMARLPGIRAIEVATGWTAPRSCRPRERIAFCETG